MDIQGDIQPTGAERVGADLRAARERLNWSIDQVAQGLRIRQPYIEALEAGKWSDLPGEAYAVGFLRTYAGVLGMDANELIRKMKLALPDPPKKSKLNFPAPVPERGIPTGAVILLSMLVVAGAYIGWYRLSGDGRLPPETVAPLPERLAPLAEQAIPRAAEPVPAPVPAVMPEPPATAAPPQATAMAPLAAPIPSAPAPSSSAPAVASAPAPAAVAPATPPANPDASRIVIRAVKGDTWLFIRDSKGSPLFNNALRSGDKYDVPAKATGGLINIGNVVNAEVTVDGSPVPPWRIKDGTIRRDLPADPEIARQGKWPGQGDTPIASAAPPSPAAPASEPSPPPRPAPRPVVRPAPPSGGPDVNRAFDIGKPLDINRPGGH